MTWKQAKAHALLAFERLGENLKSQGYPFPECLQGQEIPVTQCAAQEDLDAFRPDEKCTIHDHLLINRAFLRLLGKHKGVPVVININVALYKGWLNQYHPGKPNTAGLRAAYASHLHRQSTKEERKQ